MSDDSLDKRLRLVMSQVEKAKAQLDKCVHRKKEALNEFEQAKKGLRKHKGTIGELRSEIEIVSSAKADQEKEATEKWQVRIDTIEKDNFALKMEIKELEKIFSMQKKNLDQYLAMDKEIQLWNEQLPYLITASKYHGPENLKLYKEEMNVGDFPAHGNLEEKLQWLRAYGRFIRALENR